jgi:hypothetical protein
MFMTARDGGIQAGRHRAQTKIAVSYEEEDYCEDVLPVQVDSAITGA